MTDYLAGLNAEQRAAVTFPLDKPLKVVAGAGTGKTRVLTTRYVHILVQDPACGPENILALTFTDKAAAEMRQRISALCREVGGCHRAPGPAGGLDRHLPCLLSPFPAGTGPGRRPRSGV
jgi:superfamily I DNA/RNA helicase